MYLKRLRDFAEANGDMPLPFHTWASVRWLVDLDSQGQPVGQLVDLAVPDDPSRRSGKRELVPKLQRSGTAPQPLLACDDVKNALGWADPQPPSGSDTNKQVARATLCHNAFVTLVADCSQQHPHDRGVHALHAFLTGGGPKRLPRPDKYNSSELVMFRVDGDLVHQSPSVRDHWMSLAKARKSSGSTGVCLICGHVGSLVDTFPRQITAGLIPALGYTTRTATPRTAPNRRQSHWPA